MTRPFGFVSSFFALALSVSISAPGLTLRTDNNSTGPRTPSPADSKLLFVVALFRHGVRSPEPSFDQKDADQSSRDKWPALADWGVMKPTGECDPGNGWGYLTAHGEALARGLGNYYGRYYQQNGLSKGFSVYLWADAANQRTRATAYALAAGFRNVGNQNVTVASLPACAVDPLFHPFQAGCGTPDAVKLKAFAGEINSGWLKWVESTYSSEFRELYLLLNCFDQQDCAKPLGLIVDQASSCASYSANCKSPILWKGQFSYASSASEAFLLEYANRMTFGWGRIDPPTVPRGTKISDMLRLHEFYFDKTDRYVREGKGTDDYLASIEGSNLIREIRDQINRKVGLQPDGNCPRATSKSDFVGFVGHDTNLATVQALLGLKWQFDDKDLPADTFGLPANDALPAGALVFELRQRTDGAYFVRVEYATQSLSAMRTGATARAFRIPVEGPACLGRRPCEIPLNDFQQLIKSRLGNGQFLSHCDRETPPQQICAITPSRTRKRGTARADQAKGTQQP